MAKHELKTWPAYFEAVKRGDKTFGVRRDDRGFQKGDTVVLKKRSSKMSEYFSDTLRFRIGWILTGGQFGIEAGHVVFSLEEIKRTEL